MASSWEALGLLNDRRVPRFKVALRVSWRIASADTDRVKLPVGDGGARLVTETGDTGPKGVTSMTIRTRTSEPSTQRKFLCSHQMRRTKQLRTTEKTVKDRLVVTAKSSRDTDRVSAWFLKVACSLSELNTASFVVTISHIRQELDLVHRRLHQKRTNFSQEFLLLVILKFSIKDDKSGPTQHWRLLILKTVWESYSFFLS